MVVIVSAVVDGRGVVVCVVDEHTDEDDGRRASVSLALSAAGHARRISRRVVGVWSIGKKRKERSVFGCLGKRKKRFYLPCQGPPGPDWLAISLGVWSGRALATGTAWAGLCLIHHHQAGKHPPARREPLFRGVPSWTSEFLDR